MVYTLGDVLLAPDGAISELKRADAVVSTPLSGRSTLVGYRKK